MTEDTQGQTGVLRGPQMGGGRKIACSHVVRQVPVTKREAKGSPDQDGNRRNSMKRKGLGGKLQVREDEIRRMSVGAQMLVNPQSARQKQVLMPGRTERGLKERWSAVQGQPRTQRARDRRAAALSSAPETETEKVGGGARILKYERSRCARPSSAANSIGHASPNYSSSSHSAAADWSRDDAFYEIRVVIGCDQPWTVDPGSGYQKFPLSETSKTTREVKMQPGIPHLPNFGGITIGTEPPSSHIIDEMHRDDTEGDASCIGVKPVELDAEPGCGGHQT
ncbi:hypothetical protein BO83DRAFT_402737 [Aspergillus eucalypticola CBS 122712]|uniref:Uncharacterized protein n=1 Tax=Aspergillus eucalypticola (strain CBS 122712 / IBT 29274) TaxID=1448314 RepID=A0A317UQE3_ASPEC|nr:uncharacterized protein BO83DRAFT_402737 [Aspergillus eucalypticola CBS 122712]PWY63921.1 hypothetical protein BO83DRAFT_402737 [Aspergillus eucalypticola CBS 122712]